LNSLVDTTRIFGTLPLGCADDSGVKRLLAVFLLTLMLSAAISPDDFISRLFTFHNHYDRFMRAYLGCPPGAKEPGDCQPAKGLMDYGEFNKARQAATQLFDLKPENTHILPAACR
jgi:hypothetical protein